MAIELGARVKLNTQEFGQDLQSFINNTNGLLQPIGESKNSNILSPNAMLSTNNQYRQLSLQQNLNQSLTSLTESISTVLNSFKSFNKNVDEFNKNSSRQNFNNYSIPTVNMPEKNGNMGIKGGIMGLYSTGLGYATAIDSGIQSYRRQAMNADYLGAASTGWNTAGNFLTGAAGIAALIPGGAIATPFLATGAAIAKIIGNRKDTENAEFNKQMELSGALDPFIAAYGGSNKYDNMAMDNYNEYVDKYNTLRQKNIGTGLHDTDFLNYVSEMNKYGVTDSNRAADMVIAANSIARNTNGDINSIMSFMGTVERYGGSGTSAISYAKAAADKSGLNGTQFTEFLQGLTSAVETGISKGFIKSADEVSDSLTMLAMASGNNPLWQGTQGANRYSQMVNAMAQNTSLANTSNMLLYRAADTTMQGLINNGASLESILGKGGYLSGSSYANTMAYIEKGDLSPEFIRNLYNNINAAYGGDKDSIVETLKQQFGLNYEGGIQVANMFEEIANNPSKYSNTQISKVISEQQAANGDVTTTFHSAVTEKMDNVNEELSKISNNMKSIVDGLGGVAHTVDSNSVDASATLGAIVNIPDQLLSGDYEEKINYFTEQFGLDKDSINNDKYKNFIKKGQQVASESSLKSMYYDPIMQFGTKEQQAQMFDLLNSLIVLDDNGDAVFAGRNKEQINQNNQLTIQFYEKLDELVKTVKNLVIVAQ